MMSLSDKKSSLGHAKLSAVASASILLASTLLVGIHGDGEPSQAGGAGHALLFADHAVVLKNFKNFAKDAFTFEAWIQTSDFCNRGAIMSYAKNNPGTSDPTPFNHFVVFDELNLLACHDYKYIDLWPDPRQESCNAAYNRTFTANYVERTPTWHHLAVTWTKADDGLTKIFKDGLLMAEARTKKTDPLESNGAFMLGNEQDCYAGCTDSAQSFYGLMDEVRLWKTARTQEEILSNMRKKTGLENHKDLIAYWKFNDPDQEAIHKDHLLAKDSSGNGNDLPLVTPPIRNDVTIDKDGHSFATSSLTFANNYALNPDVVGMPDKDFTVEFWAKTPAYNKSAPGHTPLADLFNYATHLPAAKSPFGGGVTDSVFVDDAIRIEKYYQELRGSMEINHQDISTVGSLSVHVNGNTDGNGERFENWLDFAVDWVDGGWHHIAVTWARESGEMYMYFDGQSQTPFWRSQSSAVTAKDPKEGGVDRNVAKQTDRHSEGSLVLGQDQQCYGGCFSPQRALDGELANVRVWNKVRQQTDIQKNMYVSTPSDQGGLVLMYNFASSDVSPIGSSAGSIGKQEVKASVGDEKNKLLLWADAPRWEYSTAPLMEADGKPVELPFAGSGGHAFYFNDQQVLMLSKFKDFPSTALTVEFWMWTVDTCRDGVPISYATDAYEKGDNTFLVFNYRDWGVSVMEDEGHASDHFSGISATDGTWHHIAVTWKSDTGETILYDNGRKVWAVTRAKGKTLPSGGTLVLGREQDCTGGCFDSMAGASGGLDHNSYREYGPQDFFGVMDEMRIWRTARSQEQIIDGMKTALHRSGAGGSQFGGGSVSTDDKDLVAYWKFDEGQGYIVADATGHGHDLHATSTPHWQVVRWLADCGNGVVEGFEECDVGSTTGGNGCSKECKVEDGWECTATSPSVCSRLAPGQTPAPRPPPPPPRSHSDSPPSAHGGKTPSSGDAESGSSTGGSSGGLSGWGIFGIVLGVLVVGVAGVGFLYRETLLDNFPQVGVAVDNLRSRFGGGGASYGGLDHLDPEENLDLSPEFLGATAARHPQGPYRPLENENSSS